MLDSKSRALALYLGLVWIAGCRGCETKTPVPFKRVVADAGPAADAPEQQAAVPEPGDEATSYPEGTQKIVVSKTTIERRAGAIRASVARDLNDDQQPDVLIIEGDDRGRSNLEVVLHGTGQASSQLVLSPEPLGRGCRSVGAKLSLMGTQLGMASVDFLCDLPGTAAAPAAPSPGAAVDPPERDLAPPEPDAAIAQTQHFVFTLGVRPQLLLRLCADWPAESEPISPELEVSAADVDGDQVEDVQVGFATREATALATKTAPKNSDAPAPSATLTLTWLNRTTGLARERQEPEESLRNLASEAQRLVGKKPQEAVTLGAQAIALHHLLCKESGGARLWVDDTRGVSCGPSNAAGKALAATAIAQARLQRLLPALEARAMLAQPAYTVDKTTREQVAAAIGTIRGDTSYAWQMGPALRPPTTPSLRLPALGFIDENTLLLRGAVAQSYDLQAHLNTPTGMPGSVLASDSGQQFVLTDILHGCDGYRVRIVPAGSVIGGIVTGAAQSEPILQPEAASPEAASCTPGSRPHSDHGGFVLLGVNAAGAVFARGKHLWLLPLDARGEATFPAREVGPNAGLPPLNTPGALSSGARHLALATSEGVALIDRAQDSARLIRAPASCAGGQVSDAVVSPSGKKLAMLCAGRVYVAEPAAESGMVDRP
ncbi:MAG: hypothetical protein ABW321_04530 [Polyangiales bacterium]